nr:hypothetical protein [Roseburia faecis]
MEITSPEKLPTGQTMERMKEGYSKIGISIQTKYLSQ